METSHTTDIVRVGDLQPIIGDEGVDAQSGAHIDSDAVVLEQPRQTPAHGQPPAQQ
jgi:hypothetical protein